VTVHAPITYSCFDVEIDGGVAHIRLKRPEAMNTMTRDFWNELPAIVHDIDDNARARCIVISSRGSTSRRAWICRCSPTGTAG
jgi:enoyl-CoA hydratase